MSAGDAERVFQGETDTVLVAGVMRTGQTWLCYLLAHALNARMVEPYCLLRGIVYTGNDYVRGLTQGSLPGRLPSRFSLVVKTHEQPDPHFSLTRHVVLIVRDPRDTATSAALRYHVMTSTGTDVEEDARGLSLNAAPIPTRPTLKDRLWRLVYGNRFLSIVMIARRWRAFHRAWRRVPFVHVVRFEDLVRDPVARLAEICRHLGIVVPEEQLKDSADRLSMAEIKKHETGDPTKSIGFRKGVVGDFKNHLSRLELAVIRHYCRDAAAHFGYEL